MTLVFACAVVVSGCGDDLTGQTNDDMRQTIYEVTNRTSTDFTVEASPKSIRGTFTDSVRISVGETKFLGSVHGPNVSPNGVFDGIALEIPDGAIVYCSGATIDVVNWISRQVAVEIWKFEFVVEDSLLETVR